MHFFSLLSTHGVPPFLAGVITCTTTPEELRSKPQRARRIDTHRSRLHRNTTTAGLATRTWFAPLACNAIFRTRNIVAGVNVEKFGAQGRKAIGSVHVLRHPLSRSQAAPAHLGTSTPFRPRKMQQHYSKFQVKTSTSNPASRSNTSLKQGSRHSSVANGRAEIDGVRVPKDRGDRRTWQPARWSESGTCCRHRIFSNTANAK